MNKKNFIVGIYDCDEKLLHAVEKIRARGIKITDVYSPFPIHGLDPLLGLKHSRIPDAGFIFGLIGTITAVSLQIYTYTIDWPVNVGGKPSLPFPSFMPIIFELTVLISAIGMFLTHLYSNRLAPGVQPQIVDPRQTDDWFIIIVEADSDASKNTQVSAAYNDTGAIIVREQELMVRA